MVDDFLSKFFPGSSTPLDFEARKAVKEKEIGEWDAKPLIFNVGGVPTEFFTIGQLATALGNRSANTLRAWEKEAIIPKSPYVKSSQDPRGRRRLYTRAMVEGMVRIAQEEGVLWPHKGTRLTETQFTPRVLQLFKTLLQLP